MTPSTNKIHTNTRMTFIRVFVHCYLVVLYQFVDGLVSKLFFPIQ